MSVRLDVRPQADGRLHSAIGAARAGSVQIQDDRPLSLRGVAVRNERVMEFPHKKTDLLLCQT